MTRATITRADVVAAALDIAESDGVRNLTMRKLAASLGVAVTAIYWHIGNRDALVDAMVEAEMEGWKEIHPSGRSPRARIVSFARTLRKRLLAHRNVVEMISERGMIFDIFIPTYEALAAEFLAAGLGETEAAAAVRAIQLHVVGSVVLQRRAERDPSRARAGSPAGSAPERVARLALAIPSDRAFESATELLVDGLLGIHVP